MRAGELGVDVRGRTKRAAGAHQGPREPGLPVRGGRGVVRAAGPAQRSPTTPPPFEVLDVVVISERRRGNSMFAEATVKLRIGDETVHTVAEGDGPGARAGRRVSQGAEPALSAGARRPPGRLQGPHPGPEAATGAQDARADRGGARRASAGARSACRPTSSRPARPRWPTRWSCRWPAPPPPPRPPSASSGTRRCGRRSRPAARSGTRAASRPRRCTS